MSPSARSAWSLTSGGVVGPEAFNQGIEIRKLAVVESDLKRQSEFGLAGAFMRPLNSAPLRDQGCM
jgi:hypothetical protein